MANKKAIPLLKALNELGLKTRTHHIDNDNEFGFFSILLDGVTLEIREIYERDSDRIKYNGKRELLITFKQKE